jgi:hypothetical protein
LKRFTLLLFAACAALLATVPTAKAAEIRLTFTEYIDGAGPGNDTLVVDYGGNVLDSSYITGTPDNWLVDISPFSIFLDAGSFPQSWESAPGQSGYNVITQVDDTTLQFVSGSTTAPTADNYCHTGIPLHNAVSCLSGIDADFTSTVYTDVTVVAPPPQAPEPVSIVLIATGLAGVALVRRRRLSR